MISLSSACHCETRQLRSGDLTKGRYALSASPLEPITWTRNGTGTSPKEWNKCSTHASYWRSFFHSFPLPAGTSAPKMVTSLCPLRLVHHVDNSSTINLLVWKCMLLWRGYFPRRLPAFLLVYLPVCLLIPWSPWSMCDLFRILVKKEVSQSLLISFMLNYSKRESIHVLHHFLGRYRLSPVRFFLY
jgi:hypothetical protein